MRFSTISQQNTDSNNSKETLYDTLGDFANQAKSPKRKLLAPERNNIIGSLMTHTDRYGQYSSYGWGASSSWTTFLAYSASTDNSLIQFFNMILGDGMARDGTSQIITGGDSSREIPRQLQFSNGNRLGHRRDLQYNPDNTTNNTGMAMRIIPIRNTSEASILIPLYAYTSNYWSSGYEGNQLFYVYPNPGKYSNVTVVNSVNISQEGYTTSSEQNALSGTISIPGNTTVLVCLISTDFYITTNRFRDTNYFYNLSTTFSNPNIICDMRMLSSIKTSNFKLPYAAAATGNATLAPLWTMTAQNYGDR